MTISTKKRTLTAFLATGVLFALAGCGAAPEAPASDGGSTSGGESGASDFVSCIVSDEGGFDDKSFNQLSYEGTKKAATEIGGDLKDTFKEAQSQSSTDYEPNMTSMVGQGCNAIVAVGFALGPATVSAANANPDVDFLIVDDAADADFDGTPDAPNIKPLLYDTAQAAFLAGYLSAGHSTTGKVGTFGGMEFPTVTVFMDGFKQGVDYYNTEKGTSVSVVGWDGTTGTFTGGFSAGPEAKAVAQSIIDQGVDVLFPVGGPIYQSAQTAITESDKDIALIGADADLFVTDPSTADLVLTSVLKGMDVSTYEAVLAASKGEFDATAYIGTLENGGVGIADLHNFADKVDAGLQDEVAELQKAIIAGDIKVESYLN